ncbi:MAG: DUF6602 domain-containing protein [Candidatus Gastranaerophilaceae bacterium]|nr:DUF6602 domain-containing protein [Candidatus Gastranaerophilaceae bacterium]
MPDYKHYRKSISNELISIKDRVRDFVNHFPEDGRYKEIILKNVLIKHLPKTVSIGTGFVMCDNHKSTSQIDIIIYDNRIPPLFQIDDFVIVVKESVLGIIEVKSKLYKRKFKEINKKAHKNGQLIVGEDDLKLLFNGIFAYETDLDSNDSSLPNSIISSLNEHHGQVRHICFGKDIFMRYWYSDPQRNFSQNEHCGFYKLEDLSFGYFISNLLESILINVNQNGCYVYNCVQHTDVFYQYLYPLIENGGKEDYSIEDWKVIFN